MMQAITTKGTAVVWMVVLLAALSKCAIPSAQAADSHVEGAMIFPPIEELAVPKGEVCCDGPRGNRGYAKGMHGQNSRAG